MLSRFGYVIVLYTIFSILFVKSDTVAKTECGNVSGKSSKVVNDDGTVQTVHEFLNIPFALSPVQDRRWRAPVDLKEGGGCWKGTLEYNERIVACPQQHRNDFVGDENCLILSVRTPTLNPKKPLPVAVWIHGGGMIVGHSRHKGYYPDSQFTASMNVVSVSINYRLNYFGFLSLEELWENKTTGGFGNYGIMDQILALKWVQKNIKHFGGDRNQVTVFGESGGGTAVYALLAASTTLAKNLFQRIIPMSGISNFRTTHIKANEIFRPVIENTGCIRDTKSEVAECLRNSDKKIILDVLKRMPMTGGYSFDFPFNKPYPNYIPVAIVDPLIIRSPLEDFVKELISKPEKNKLDILVGFAAQEVIIPWMTPLLPKWNWSALKFYLKPRYDSFKRDSYSDILKVYRHKSQGKVSPFTIDPFYVYTVMISDVRVGCTTTRKAKLFASYSPFRVTSYVMSQPIETKTQKPVAGHAYDSIALFGFGLLPEYQPTKNDLELKKNIRGIFRQFFHADSAFDKSFRGKTIEFWNNKLVSYSHLYREKECKMLRDIGLSRQAWGNLGIYND